MSDTQRQSNRAKGFAPLRERALIALVIAAAICTTLDARRFHTVRRDGLHDDAFWALKVNWRNHDADVVIAGDSRVLTAVSTEAMHPHLGDRRIINFAFLGVGYGPDYLAAVRAALDTSADRPIIVLGISPRSFTEGACEQKWFGPRYRQHFLQRQLLKRCSSILRFARPMDHADLMITLGLADPPGKRNDLYFHSDGWQSADTNQPHRDALDEYRTKFDPDDEGPVSSAVIGGFIETVRSWRAEGIIVYAFRTPSCADMVAMEDEISGFDEADFVRRFAAAGGTWLPIDQTAYASYDGSHLDVRSAPAFSADLARAIAARERNNASEPSPEP